MHEQPHDASEAEREQLLVTVLAHVEGTARSWMAQRESKLRRDKEHEACN